MNKLVPEDLYSLEAYAKVRDENRASVMAHKQHRRLMLGEHVLLLFEDRTTIKYQVQEMLRIERIFEEAGILEELDAYNPLIPDGSNWKATMMIQYTDPGERRVALERLIGIEDRVWIKVDGYDPVFAIADEDLDRATESKTSSVHFLRFELTTAMRDAVKHGASLDAGIDHPEYVVEASMSEPMRESLITDLA
ncbi:MAG: DUF3501 family protein [Gammaproteobacteria bacterium]